MCSEKEIFVVKITVEQGTEQVSSHLYFNIQYVSDPDL